MKTKRFVKESCFDCADAICDECDHDPEQCSACEGTGVTGHRVTVYEHGCGFPHYDTEERPCAQCGGTGGYGDQARPYVPERPYPPIQMQDDEECPF